MFYLCVLFTATITMGFVLDSYLKIVFLIQLFNVSPNYTYLISNTQVLKLRYITKLDSFQSKIFRIITFINVDHFLYLAHLICKRAHSKAI